VSGWIIAPILLPAVTAPFLVLALRQSPKLQRAVSLAATALLLAIAIGLFVAAADGVVRPYLLGAWPAPFGIVLVLDRLSALMVLLTAALALVVLLYAANGWDRRGHHFHPLFQFQLMGINGAFLTGDVFNLFVFFEVMLIASYGLLLHGGGPRRLGAGFLYVAINLVGSTLFLFAVGLIYAVTGTLNMADLAGKAAGAAEADAALLRTGGLLLLLVFAIKAALVPLHWWLPTAYAAAPAPVAALFAIMTKVGAYAIIRVFALVFGSEAGPVAGLAAPYVAPAALATLAVGAIGILASRKLLDLVCFAVLWSMGSLLLAVGMFDAKGLAAALYYTLHSTLIAAALFLIAELAAVGRPGVLDRLVAAPPIPRAAAIGGLFFAAGIGIAGLPPLSGFIGKLLILDATRTAPGAGWIWALLLGTSLLVIIGFGRAGSVLFWKAETLDAPVKVAKGPRSRLIAVAALLVGGTALLSAFAGPITRQMEATARQALDRSAYMQAVLGPTPTIQEAQK
jgi:multicomponent K+:H+ antiporter subunit D